jgi:hypothetical protein
VISIVFLDRRYAGNAAEVTPSYADASVSLFEAVGAAVGAVVGKAVGAGVVAIVGESVGEGDGARVGSAVGAIVGAFVQVDNTHSAHCSLLAARPKNSLQQAAQVQPSSALQLKSGFTTSFVGDAVGILVGDGVGVVVGVGVGDGVGTNVLVGSAVGAGVGANVGTGDGNGVGDGVGVAATAYTTPPILISSPTKMVVLRSTAQPTSTSPFTTATVAANGSQAYAPV